ncbi:MAG: prepilin-type N-terminal cleavage/methylation domain-containing protein [Kiloniellales bacterium]|nr:prepilin-type N-terminal cleavage/methylation domain-containing protein [Kiloniellales bacterium]
MTARPETDSQGGFTLLELLVAISVFALLSVMMYGGLNFGIRAWERVGEADTRQSDVQLVQNLLRRAFAEVQPAEVGGPRRRLRLAFEGDRDGLVFVGPMPAYLGPGGNHLIGLQVEGAGRERALTLRWEVFREERPDLAFTEAAEREVLLFGVQDLRLRYFGAEDEALSPQWRSQWRDDEALPRLIQAEVDFAPGDRRLWPELIVALMTDEFL